MSFSAIIGASDHLEVLNMELTFSVVQRYLDMCKNEKKLDKKTLKAYRIDLRQFEEYLSENEMSFDRESLKAYTSHMNQKFQPRTVRRKNASIRAFSTWLMDEQLLEQNPFEKLRLKVQEPKTLPRDIPLREMEKLLEAAHARMNQYPDDRTAVCDTAAMELLFATGMRVSELSNMKTRDIDLIDGVIHIWGKGAKERIIQLTNAEVLAVLRKYEAIYQPKKNEEFLRNRRGSRLSEQSIRGIVRKYAKLSGISTRITPHMFRHTVATQLLNEDVDIRNIQQLLGHSSILTTQIYTHVMGAKQREIMETKHPRNRFSFPQESANA